MLQLHDIEKKYQMGDQTVYALRGVSLQIRSGEFVAIMGPSGSGKSTLMHILGLLDSPDGGSYRLDGREVATLSEDDLAVLRRETIGFVFQQFNLLPRMSAVENAALPLLYSRQRIDLERGRAVMERVGLGTRMGHRPNELSGGQQQRVAIARALVNNPRIIFADEPTGNLDSASEKEIMGALKELNAQGITVILVTHEEEIGRQAKRLIRMRDGCIQSDEQLVAADSARAEPQAPALTTQGNSIGKYWQYFVQGLKTLTANKVRTGLSMLGILIGVAAVVAMMALGQGAQQAIERQLAGLGSNLLVLRSGASRIGGVTQDTGAGTRLTVDDANYVRDRVATVKQTAPAVNGRGQVVYLNKNWSTQLLGAVSQYAKVRAATPEVGRFFTDEENQRRALVAVVGQTVARELFGAQNPIGEMIKINKVNFQVIGILPEKGANAFRDQDDMIVIPLNTAMHRLLGKNYVDYIDIEVIDAAAIEATQKAVSELMLSRHKVPLSQGEEAFQIRNMADVQSALAESSKTMGALLASIAAISLLVGGIGIMNIMLVSVTERTREIGLRKAIGARRGDILFQFLVESVVVSVVGGLIGIALGSGITVLLANVAGWTTSISMSSVLLAFLFSASIGMIFGIYPATKASRLHPIVALRYE
ncbi:MAG: ABC transporter permease [Gammaproteobacteria bacterium]|nr:ABC transporter permease [Gammaproteobacteria bacterium]